MSKRSKNIGRADSGFSLVELLVVLAIIMIISAMALPNIVNTVRQMKVRSTGTSIAGLFEQARMTAIQQNKTIEVRNYVDATDGRLRYYIDVTQNKNYTAASNEPIVILPAGYSVPSTPPSGIASSFPSGVTIRTLAAETEGSTPTTFLGFNARGLPCTGTPCNSMLGGGSNTGSTNYVTYFNDGTQTGAVAVYQTGKVKVYVYSGSSYQ